MWWIFDFNKASSELKDGKNVVWTTMDVFIMINHYFFYYSFYLFIYLLLLLLLF